MIYEFRYPDKSGELRVIGTGRGDGEKAVRDAFNDLRRQLESEGTFPSGEYQYRPANEPLTVPGVIPDLSIGTEWAPLTLDAQGNIEY
jgi:hypothetical protein